MRIDSELIESVLINDNDPRRIATPTLPLIYGYIDLKIADSTYYLFTTKPYLFFRHEFIYYLPNHMMLLGSRWLPVSHFPLPNFYPFPTYPQKILFLGDMNFDDIAIFLWLKSKYDQFEMIGINDTLLEQCNISFDNLCWLDANDDEISVMEKLQFPVDLLEKLVGPKCTKMLLSHRKIELDGIANFHTEALSNFLRVLEPEKLQRIYPLDNV
jgi:hypothetical protein